MVQRFPSGLWGTNKLQAHGLLLMQLGDMEATAINTDRNPQFS